MSTALTAAPPRPGAKAGTLIAAGLAALTASIAISVTIGAAELSVTDVLSVVADRLGWSTTELSPIVQGIVWQLRLPRTLLAAMCGAGLALSGAVLQSLLRNPLADPFLLGISAGASAGAVAILVLGVGGGLIGLAGGAFVGALIAFGLVITLATLAGGGTAKVILSGVAATQLFSAITSFVVIVSADAEQTRGVLFWLLGSLSGARWEQVGLAGTVGLACGLLCLSRAGALDAFAFGTDAATSLGVPVRRLRALLLTATALLAAALVAVAGAIGFAGLVVPHAARLLVGPAHRALLPITAVLGAVLLVWVDTLARIIAAPQEVPVGVVTALVGVPAFVVLLVRRRTLS